MSEPSKKGLGGIADSLREQADQIDHIADEATSADEVWVGPPADGWGSVPSDPEGGGFSGDGLTGGGHGWGDGVAAIDDRGGETP